MPSFDWRVSIRAWCALSACPGVHAPGSKGRADRPARHQETSKRQFEQDWLELGRRVAGSLHYRHPGNLRLLQAAKAEQGLATASTTRATHSSPDQ